MYRILIADDEEIIRNGLANTVPWNEWGYMVVGLAENGKQAVELLDRTKPDVILTDVRMPKLDGLALAKHLKENFPDIKIVILSGYNDPDYLQEAIKNKVVVYLNKPTDYDELQMEFHKLKEELDKERSEKAEYDRLQDYLEESLPHMRQIFFFDFLLGAEEQPENLATKMDFYNISMPQPDMVIILIEIDNQYKICKSQSHEEVYLLFQTIIYLANNIFEQKNFFYDNSTNRVTGLCSYTNINRNITRLQKEFFALKNIPISIGVSGRAADIQHIHGKWEQAAKALAQKVFLGEGSVIFYDDEGELKASASLDVRREINKIIDVVFFRDKSRLEKDVLKLFAKFEINPTTVCEDIDKICLEILFALERAVGTPKLTLYSFLESKSKKIFDIFKFDSIYEKKEWLMDVIIGFLEKTAHEARNKMNAIVREAMEYINENYTNNNLSLDLVADVVGKNPAYLSTLFKNEAGCNFSEYVRTLRIEKGKELLVQSSLKIYEISERIGYADVSNFTKVFRKCIGVSPGEFRNVNSVGLRDE